MGIKKRGAMELSMSTIVIIVLAMALLIGGIALVRNIVGGANEVVDLTQDNVLTEINSLFSQGDDIVVKLGSSKTQAVVADGTPAGIVVSVSTIDGNTVDISSMKYRLSLDRASTRNCVTEIGEADTAAFFSQAMEQDQTFDASSGSIASAQVLVSIPEGTQLCNQKVFFDAWDGSDYIGRDYFNIEVKKKGIF